MAFGVSRCMGSHTIRSAENARAAQTHQHPPIGIVGKIFFRREEHAYNFDLQELKTRLRIVAKVYGILSELMWSGVGREIEGSDSELFRREDQVGSSRSSGSETD